MGPQAAKCSQDFCLSGLGRPVTLPCPLSSILDCSQGTRPLPQHWAVSNPSLILWEHKSASFTSPCPIPQGHAQLTEEAEPPPRWPEHWQ